MTAQASAALAGSAIAEAAILEDLQSGTRHSGSVAGRSFSSGGAGGQTHSNTPSLPQSAAIAGASIAELAILSDVSGGKVITGRLRGSSLSRSNHPGAVTRRGRISGISASEAISKGTATHRGAWPSSSASGAALRGRAMRLGSVASASASASAFSARQIIITFGLAAGASLSGASVAAAASRLGRIASGSASSGARAATVGRVGQWASGSLSGVATKAALSRVGVVYSASLSAGTLYPLPIPFPLPSSFLVTEILPKRPWTQHTYYPLGSSISTQDWLEQPSPAYLMVAVVAGTSDDVPPGWPASPGVMMRDGSVVWICYGIDLDPSVGGPIPSWDNPTPLQSAAFVTVAAAQYATTLSVSTTAPFDQGALIEITLDDGYPFDTYVNAVLPGQIETTLGASVSLKGGNRIQLVMGGAALAPYLTDDSGNLITDDNGRPIPL